MPLNLGLNYYNQELDALFGVGTPATLYMALFTTAPTNAGGGTEVVTTGGTLYARVSITNNSTNFPNAVSGVKSNGTAVTFPTAGATWGTITSWALMSASSGGNVVFWDNFANSRQVFTGDGPVFAIGALQITCS